MWRWSSAFGSPRSESPSIAGAGAGGAPDESTEANKPRFGVTHALASGAWPTTRRSAPARASNLAHRAFRRPVTPQDLEAPLGFYQAARQNGDFEFAIREALPAILASPKFLYRTERTPRTVKAGRRASDHAISSSHRGCRIFLTGRAPDEPLLAAAEKGTLASRKRSRRRSAGCSADPRSKSLVTNFAFQWLKLRALDDADPDAILFPNFDEGLREAFRREMELFVESVFREDRSVLDLLTADYTFVNERLALHYGIPNVRGEPFPPGDAGRSESLGTARQGRRADGDVLCEPHGAGAARRVDSREPPGHAAGGAAAGRRRRSRRTRTARRRGPSARSWSSIARSRRATRATASWIRSASRWRISTPSASGATPIAGRARRSTRRGKLGRRHRGRAAPSICARR